VAIALLGAAVLVPRAWLFARWVPVAGADGFYAETLATRFVAERLAAAPPAGYRVAGLDAALVPHAAAFFGFEEPRAYDPMTYAPYRRFLGALGEVPRIGWVQVLDPARPALAMLGVRYVFDHPSMTDRPGVAMAYRGRDAIVYEVPGALPRLFVPRRLAVVAAPEAAVDAAREIGDFAELAVVDRGVEEGRVGEGGSGGPGGASSGTPPAGAQAGGGPPERAAARASGSGGPGTSMPEPAPGGGQAGGGVSEGAAGTAAAGPPAGPSTANGEARVEDLVVGRGTLRATVTAATPALLATSQPAMPGWRMALDGAPLDPARRRTVNGAFLGVALPPGRHTLDLRYVPPGWPAALWLAALGVLTAAGLLAPIRPRRRS
jgi:hypothetical protein